MGARNDATNRATTRVAPTATAHGSGLRTSLRRQTGRTPFGQTVFQAADVEATGAEHCDGLIRQHAIRSAAVGNDLLIRIEFGKPLLQLAKRDIDGAGHVTKGEFILGAKVEHRHEPRLEPVGKLLARDRFKTVAFVEIAAHHLCDLGRTSFGDAPERGQQFENCVVRKAIEHELAFAPDSKQPCTAHLLQVLRGIGDRQSGAVGEDLNAPFALRKLLKKSEPMRVRRAFATAAN